MAIDKNITEQTITTADHPLVRDGKSQVERMALRALTPETLQLDDRSERQLLVYLYEFAKSITYYAEDFSQSNWQDFLTTGSSVQVALISEHDANLLNNQFTRIEQNFVEGLNRDNYAPLLDFLFDSAFTVNGWFNALSRDEVLLDGQVVFNESPLRRIVQDLISSNLSQALIRLIGVANLFTQSPLRYTMPDFTALSENKAWALSPAALGSRDNALARLVNRPFEFEKTVKERFDEIFRIFSKAVRQIVDNAQTQDILLPTGTHEPHLALLYTFLRLLRTMTDELNRFPKRHLDFYYRDVLGLKLKPHVPDAAHVIFELPKPISQYKVAEKTLLKDGKDINGIDIRFGLNEEIVVNRTQIAELRTIFNHKKLYGAPKAPSEDGMGKDFADPSTANWATLGSVKNPLATVGFAMISPVLLLENGKRDIKIELTCNKINFNEINLKTAIQNGCFNVSLSGSKGWFMPKAIVKHEVKSNTLLEINFSLAIGEPPIIAPNDPSVFGSFSKYNYGGLIKFELKQHEQDSAPVFLYDAFRKAKLLAATITATVSELQNVIIQTEDGVQDPKKPFMPFGAVPSVGSAFFIGSPEIFSKRLESLSFKYEWDKKSNFTTHYKGYEIVNGVTPPDSDDDFKKTIFIYKKGKFVKKNTTINLFDTTITIPKTDFSGNLTPADTPSVTVAKDPDWQAGFVMIQLENDFLHQHYATALALSAFAEGVAKVIPNRAVINIGAVKTMIDSKNDADANCDTRVSNIKTAIKNGLVSDPILIKNITINPPYTPIIKNLTIGYTAKAELNIHELIFSHLYPFENGNHDLVWLNDTLVPNFNDEGSLLIGLTEGVQGSILPILFQLLESSANTALDAPRNVTWQYLKGNVWTTLADGKNILSDETNQFIQSGIVKIVLPTDFDNTQTTILPPQYLWLKVAASDNTAAICNTVGIHTQAVKAIFQPEEKSDFTRLIEPLKSKAISKLNEADANIKGIAQPYDSFGGKAPENDSRFYARVSERLRHKGRAITLFDYEQMILEAFNEIYKVKCITHTFGHRPSQNVNDIKDITLAPGHVLIIVVPDVSKLSIAERLMPKASLGTLERIKHFIQAKTSPFVQIQVLNPIYERIHTNFRVQFQLGKSPPFYIEELKKDIENFLSPWAFDPLAKITFGGKVFKSAILGFIENRPYVDYVVDFTMTKGDDKTPRDEIVASAARVILASGEHVISDINTPVLASNFRKVAINLDKVGIGFKKWVIKK